MKEQRHTIPQKDKSVEESVRTWYDTFGWVEVDGKKTGEEISSREFRTPYYPYHEGAEQRTRDCFSKLSGTILIAGGGDMPESHISIARLFSGISCLDISEKALEIAKTKLGQNGRFFLGSILEAPFAENTFDAVLCAHVIYHIDFNLQGAAVEELIRITKPGGRLVIIYANPGSIVRKMIRATRLAKKIRKLFTRSQGNSPGSSDLSAPEQGRPRLPFSLHPLKWWKRFEPSCRVTFRPWDVMSNDQEQILIHSDRFARFVYRCASWIETAMPYAAAHLWQYPIIVIDKAKIASSSRE